MATYIDNVKLNDGKTYSRVLATYPQRVNDGVITGLYSSYVIQNGDHFKASVGFQANCGNGKVKFQLNYIENGTAISLREWNKSCDNNLLVIDVDLSSLNGKTVSFMLAVVADGAMDDDRAVWVDPRIVR
ncbi:MAG: hypothetical protein EHM70_23860 [Chloroflexota bacterium]|nr:MAG: hypothetical protein EHM70_23860 [Chloroflexota bacterium]